MLIAPIGVAIIGIIWIILGLIMQTGNITSGLVFKVFPILSGLYVLVYVWPAPEIQQLIVG